MRNSGVLVELSVRWGQGITIVFWGSVFDPKTSIWETLRDHFGSCSFCFGGLRHPRDSNGEPFGPEVDFLVDRVSLLGVTLGWSSSDSFAP